MSKTTKIIIVIIAVALISYLAYSWYKKSKVKKVVVLPPAPIVNSAGENIVSDLVNGLDPDKGSATIQTEKPLTPEEVEAIQKGLQNGSISQVFAPAVIGSDGTSR